MGIKRDEKTGTWTASYSKRPKPGMMPVSRTVKGISSEKEAIRVFQNLIKSVCEKAKIKLSPLWKDVVSEYIEDSRQRRISEKTIQSNLYVLNAHTFPYWENWTVDRITCNDILQVIKDRLSDSSPGNQQYVLRVIGRVLDFSSNRGWIQKNPTPKIHFRKVEKLKGVLTKDQVEKLLNTAKQLNHFWYPHWALALYSGMRNGELYALTWDKIDFENNLIKVDTSWNSKDGFKSTKSGDDRILEIAPDLKRILLDLKISNSGVVFVLPRNSRWDKGEQARELRMFLVGLGLPEIRFHDLRATWATLLLSKGVEPIKVMKMGGWKDLKTMQIYVRKAGVDIRGCMADFSLHDPDQPGVLNPVTRLTSFDQA